MDYEEFRKNLLKEVQGFYGRDAEAALCRVSKNNGQDYDGIRIVLRGKKYHAVPVVGVDYLYEAYRGGQMDMEDCVEAVYRTREQYEYPEEAVPFAERITDWDFVKERVYPVLLSTKENRELLEEPASVLLLDLSVAYTVRFTLPEGGISNVRINRTLLNYYGISKEELHRQARANMETDGYRFWTMRELLEEELSCGMPWEGMGELYILTNASKIYGAAGLLDRKRIHHFAEGRNFFLLPASVHEMIFLPADKGYTGKELDAMVAEINERCVAKEDRLSDHSYYYDAEADEIRISK